MKTSVSAALFSLAETTNSADGGRKERALPRGRRSLPVQMRRWVGRTAGSRSWRGPGRPASRFWTLTSELKLLAARAVGVSVGGGVRGSVSRVCQARSETPSGISYAKNVSSIFR